MGVDYSANFGIGYKVSLSEERMINNGFGMYIANNLDEDLRGTDYNYFETGEGDYTGEDNEHYVTIIDRKVVIQKLVSQLENLNNFLVDKGYDIESLGGIVGGLHTH